MENDPADASFTQLIAKPSQMPARRTSRSSIRLHLDPQHPTIRVFDQQVNLLTAILCAQVVQPRTRRARGNLGPKLQGHERVEESAHDVSVAEHAIGV